MPHSSLIQRLLALCSLFFSCAAIADIASQPSGKLLSAIPNVEKMLRSDRLAERLQVVLLLAEEPRSTKAEAKLRFDLPPADYGYVLSKCIAVMGDAMTEDEAVFLLAAAPRWVDFIRRFELEDITIRVAKLLEAKNMYAQFFALAVLGASEERRFEDRIAKLLSSPQKVLQRTARDTLIRWNSPAVVPQLIQELETGSQRGQAIVALGKISSPAAIPALLKCGSDPDETNRRNALSAARSLIPPKDRMSLLLPLAEQIFQSSTNREVVDYALAVCVDIGDPASVAPAMDRLLSPDEATRQIMHRALEEMSVSVLAGAASKALLAEQRYGESVAANEHVRAGLIAIVSRIATPEVLPALRAMIVYPDQFIQRIAISAVGKLGMKEFVSDLVRALQGKAAREAALALIRIRDRRALGELTAFLKSPGAIDGNFLYEFNDVFSHEPVKKWRITRLASTIEATPDELLSLLTKEYNIPLKLEVNVQSWADASERAGPVTVFAQEDVNNSLGRALFRLNEAGPTKYHQLWKNGALHILPLEGAAGFITEMLEAEFK